MKVSVWDSYVKRKNGNVLHFDIIVPESLKNAEIVYSYGKDFLNLKNEPDAKLDTEECRMCHIEEPSEEMIEKISKQGYYILEFEEIPAILPQNPSRRDIILHLRGHYKQFRFADFKGKTEEDVREIYNKISSGNTVV